MATTSSRRLGRDRWVQIHTSPETYERLLHDRGDRSRPALTFLDGRLTIVSPGVPHEALTERLRGLIEVLFLVLQIPCIPMGSLTLKGGDPGDKGTEADACYYLSRLDRLRGKTTLRMHEDPPPDLAIEVVVSHPVRDALKVHAAFGVREVWVCSKNRLRFLVLSEAGRYVESPASVVLPFLKEEDLAPWVFRDDVADEFALRREFMNWVSSDLSRRYQTKP